MWNVTQHQLGEPSALDCHRFFWTACIFFVPWSWWLQVCRRVSYGLPCYMGHICGLQCYDHLGRLCAVHTVQNKEVDNFSVEQVSQKADICSSSQEIPSFNGEWTFIAELKSACHWGPLWHCTVLFLMMVCQPSIPRCKCYCGRSSKFLFYLVIKWFWLGYSFCFLHLALAMSVSGDDTSQQNLHFFLSYDFNRQT